MANGGVGHTCPWGPTPGGGVACTHVDVFDARGVTIPWRGDKTCGIIIIFKIFFWGRGHLIVCPPPNFSPRTSPVQLSTPRDMALRRNALRRVQGSNQPSSSKPGGGKHLCVEDNTAGPPPSEVLNFKGLDPPFLNKVRMKDAGWG